jgi:hypothetical protein
MTFCELLLLLQERKERILKQDPHSIITQQHLYLRNQEGWAESPIAGSAQSKYGKSGEIWFWQPKEESSI